MKYAKDILNETTKKLGLKIDLQSQSRQQSKNDKYKHFGNAAGVVSAIGLYSFLRDSGGYLTLGYDSSQLLIKTWDSVLFTWRAKEILDCDFIEAMQYIHSLHNYIHALDMNDILDGLDAVLHGVDLIDGIYSLGFGLLLSQGVKYIGNKVNGENLAKESERKIWMTNKVEFLNMLKGRFPPEELLKAYEKLPSEARSI